MYTITVSFELKPGAQDQFLPLMTENAQQSRSQEPGCVLFDVCIDPSKRDYVFLYEVYRDRNAFDAHVGSGHFKIFDQRTSNLVVRKNVAVLTRVSS
jgi:(4S)-4-hydroxy-5-phosphonooxypentane-2,3-dione isomerase